MIQTPMKDAENTHFAPKQTKANKQQVPLFPF